MKTIKFITVEVFCVLAFAGFALAQGLPIPEEDPVDPKLLVGELLGNITVDNTGAASYSIPVDVSPGTAGMEPKLAISYSSQRGNGLLGVGFSVDGLSGIVRTPCTLLHDGFIDGVDFDSNDRFMLDGQRLIVVSGSYGQDGSQYRTEIDSFSRITLHGSINDSSSWFTVETKAGLIMEYGNSTGAVKPNGRAENMSWLVDKVSDTAGNSMQYIYVANYEGVTGEHLLDRIEYTSNDAMGLSAYCSVKFVYESRPDTMHGFKAGSEFNRTKRLERIRVMHSTDEVCNYQLGYIQNNSNVSLLKSVQKFIGINSIPKTVFDWNSEGAVEGWGSNENSYVPPFPLAKTAVQQHSSPTPDQLFLAKGCHLVSDVTGDGLTDVFYSEGWAIPQPPYGDPLVINLNATWLNDGDFGQYFINYGVSSTAEFLFNNDYFADFQYSVEADKKLYDPGYRFADLNGDGLLDIMQGWQLRSRNTGNVGTLRKCYMNQGVGWIQDNTYTPEWSYSYYGGLAGNYFHVDNGYRHVDLDGNGLPDLVRAYWDGSNVDRLAVMNFGNGYPSSNINENYNPPYGFLYLPGSISYNYNYDPRFIDLNGDGLVDMLVAAAGTQWSGSWHGACLNTGTGWEVHSEYESPYDLVDADGYDTGTRFVDVNGDGLVDVLNNANSVYLNTGTGWLEDTVGTYTLPENVVSGSKRDLTRFVDLNGDGLTDLIYMVGGNSPTSGYVQRTYLNNGHGWDLQTNAALYQLPHPFARNHDGQTASLGQCFADLNGDGLIDYFYNHMWFKKYVSEYYEYENQVSGAVLNQGTFGNLLNRVTKGWRADGVHGEVAELDYRPITDPDVYIKGTSQSFPYQDIQGPLYVVSEQWRDDGIGGMNRTIYSYSEAISHRDRGFLGFKTFESYDVSRQFSKIDTLRQKFPHTGSPELSQTYYIPNTNDFSSKQLIKQVQNTYLYDNVTGGTVFPYVGKSVETQWDYTTVGIRKQISSTTTYSWFDNQNQSQLPPASQPGTLPSEITHGNLVKAQIEYGDGSSEVSVNNYTSSTTGGKWHIGRLQNASVTHNLPGKASITKSSSFAYDPDTGMLTLETSEPNHATLELVNDYQYDGYGNITNKIVSGANIATRSIQRSKYDTQGRFVTEAYNALNHKKTIEEYDPKLGLIRQQRSPNGLPTSWQHDDLGRITFETRADNTTTTTAYDWTVTNAYVALTFTNPDNTNQTLQVDSAYRITTSASGAPTSGVWFDRKGREIRSQTLGPDGRTILQDTVYNALGQTVAVSLPYFENDPIYYTCTTYDPLERPRTVTMSDGTVTEYVYDGLEASVIVDSSNFRSGSGADSPKHQVTATEKNERGQVVEVTDTLNKSLQYEYHADGNLHKTIAPGNIVTEMTYDLHGNKVWQDDPDMGEWNYVYNALDQLVSQTDAKNQTTTMQYDLLGRMYLRTANDGVAKWFHDNLGEGGKLGALHREELYDGTGTNLVSRKTYAYDSLGRPLFDLMNYDNKWYYNYVRYDAFSRIKETHRFWRPQSVVQSGNQLDHHWNSFGTINTYDSIGTILEVRDTKDHVWWSRNAADYNARGNLTQFTLGNGISAAQGYNGLTGRIQSNKSYHGTDTSNVVLYNTYGFDRIGNLTSRYNASLLQAETFTYDELNRLRETRLGANLESEVTYDNSTTGNRIASKTGIGSYTYGQNGAGPHAVTLAGGISYQYDANGNLEYRSQGGTNTTHITWASFNKPLRIDTDTANLLGSEKFSEFTYGIDRQRITQIIRNGSSLKKKIYIGGMEQEESSSSLSNPVWTNTETRVFISTPSGVIGVHVQDASEQITRKYFHHDHLGSVIAVSAEKVGSNDAQILSEYSFDPWGKRRDPSNWAFQSTIFQPPSLETDRGFTGHEMLDNVELIHMNGRMYDPVLGTFLSADSYIQAPFNLQNHNRYSYVVNNPLSFTDPSGHFFALIGAWLGAAWGLVSGAIVTGVGALWEIGAYLLGTPVAAGMTLGAISGGMGDGGINGVFMGAFMGAATALAFSAVKALTIQALEYIYNALTPVEKQVATLYRVNMASGRPPVPVDPNTLFNEQGTVFINGQSNHLDKAVDLGAHYTGKDVFYLIHNPSVNGFVDTIESTLGKLTGRTPVSEGAARILARFDLPHTELFAHSQGAIITRNALAIRHAAGQNMAGLNVFMDGAAVNKWATERAFSKMGVNLSRFEAFSVDAVPNIVGLNAITTPNPFRLIGSMVSSPLLGVGGQWSPHTYSGGGSHLGWIPNLY